MNSLALTEKQQEVLWLRYRHHASINQIAAWLRNARRRAAEAGSVFPETSALPIAEQKLRTYPASQISVQGGGGMRLDDL